MLPSLRSQMVTSNPQYALWNAIWLPSTPPPATTTLRIIRKIPLLMNLRTWRIWFLSDMILSYSDTFDKYFDEILPIKRGILPCTAQVAERQEAGWFSGSKS